MIRRTVAAATLVLALALTGCAPSPTTTYSEATATSLQAGVLAVTEAAASGDPRSAVTRLAELESILLDEFARGNVSQERFDSISASIALVRADLDYAVTQLDDDKPGNSNKPDKPGKPDGG